ncbi:MAG: hypothetical protein GX045_00510 [Clostridiaceae bacterium]|nr:hypothetical protein [Clostridiaceae bacterium]
MKGITQEKIKIIILCLLMLILTEIYTGFLKAKLNLIFASDNSLTMNLRVFPGNNTTICADGSNPIFIDVALVDSEQEPVPYSLINVNLINFTGKVKPKYPITGKDGRVTITVIPDFIQPKPDFSAVQSLETDVSVKLVSNKSREFSWNGKLLPPPVLLVHGFQDTSESMIPLKIHLEGKGLLVYAIDYDTGSDIETMSGDLENYIEKVKSDLLRKGIFAGKVDIVAHSLGGLVSRYYTTSEHFCEKQNVRKIIFINVPHHGTPWAEAGAALLDAPFLHQLYPTADLFIIIFPSFINKGLNHKIQVANIALENDEVVPLPSSTLDLWGIKTKIYRIGQDPLRLDSIVSNQTSGSSFHRQILFYVPVFEDVLQFLTNNQPFPRRRK